jgi:hypothetical protein
MGASGWHYVAPYHGSVAGALRDLQERVFRERDFWWWDEFGDWEPVPASLEDLWDRESGWNSGTHSILDIREGIAADPEFWPEYRVWGLAPDEVEAVFGTPRPSRADFEALARDYDNPRHSDFNGVVRDRWTGRYVLLYEGDTPTEVGFWGRSGD